MPKGDGEIGDDPARASAKGLWRGRLSDLFLRVSFMGVADAIVVVLLLFAMSWMKRARGWKDNGRHESLSHETRGPRC